MIYLDNAATSWPKPEAVYQTLGDFLRTKGGNPGRGGHSLAIAAGGAVDETRRLVARLINSPEPERVVFTLNCTDALNLGLKGLLRPGDHVITSRMGHNSLVRPLRKLEQQGVRVTRLPPSAATGVLSVRDIEAAIEPATRLIAVTHASNVTGVIQPVEEYGAMARRRGVILLVDAAQTAGHWPIDVEAGNIDLLAFSGHKGLLGPPGTGALYVGRRVELDSCREGGTGTYSELEEQPTALPYRYESGTLNTVGIAGLGTAVKYIVAEGLDKVQAQEQHLTARLVAGLSRVPGVTLYVAGNAEKQSPVVSVTLAGYEPGEVAAILDQAFDIKVRAGLHCAPVAHKTIGTYPRGTVRFSPGYFNTADEIDWTVAAVARIATTAEPQTITKGEIKIEG